MTTEETIERIRQEANRFEDLHAYIGDGLSTAYYSGAKSERNKVLDELLEKLDRGYKDYVWYKHLRAEIDSLKVNP